MGDKAPVIYKYKPLRAPHNTRLLKIQPGSKKTDIICELHEYSNPGQAQTIGAGNQSVRGYEALSWCWGDSTENRPISIKTGDRLFRLEVRQSLYTALVHLRYENYPRLLWVDFVCINQSDKAEKGHQVARMNETYGNAFNVCIWLGEDEQNKALPALRFIKEELTKPYAFSLFVEDSTYREVWKSLVDLMKKPWFQRRWVVQEIALARQATVHLGDGFVTWQELSSAISLLVDTDGVLARLDKNARKNIANGSRRSISEEIPVLGATRLVHITNGFIKRHASSVFERTKTLEELMAWLPRFDCRDPRDMVYALLALAKDTQPTTADVIPLHLHGKRLTEGQRGLLRRIARRLPQGRRQAYPVRYDLEPVEVYTEFIKFVINNAPAHRAVDIILRPFAQDKDESQSAAPGDPAQRIGLPSWIPNKDHDSHIRYDLELYRTQLGEDSYYMQRERGDLFVGAPGSSGHYSASGDSGRRRQPKFRKRRDHYSMFVEGFVLARVETVYSQAHAGFIAQDWLELGNDPRQDLDSFCRTLCADRGPGGYAPPFFIPTLKDAIKGQRASINSQSLVDREESEQVRGVFRHIIATISGRTLIKTRDREFIGLAPGKAQKGDYVCILHGCSVPVILRRHEMPKDLEAEASQDNEFLSQAAKKIMKLIVDRKAKEAASKIRSSTPRNPAMQLGGDLEEPVPREAQNMLADGALRVIQSSHGESVTIHFAIQGLSVALVAHFHGIFAAFVQASISLFFVWPDGAKHHWLKLTSMFIAMSVLCGYYNNSNDQELQLIAPFVASSATHLFQRCVDDTISWTRQHMQPSLAKVFQRKRPAPSPGINAEDDDIKSVLGLTDEVYTVPEFIPEDDPRNVAKKYAFTLIGEAYIDTMMTGEAIRLQNESVNTMESMNTTATSTQGESATRNIPGGAEDLDETTDGMHDSFGSLDNSGVLNLPLGRIYDVVFELR